VTTNAFVRTNSWLYRRRNTTFCEWPLARLPLICNHHPQGQMTMKYLRFLLLLSPFTFAFPCFATCSVSPNPADVVQAQVEAYNRHDVEAFLSCYAEDATIYWLDGHQQPVKGMDALRAQFAFLAKIPPAGAGFGVDILTKAVTGPTVANVEHTRGLPPNAKPVPDTLVLYEVRNGKIVSCWFAPAS
jgi:uncharacterized protein (TIGR02246 family)